MINKVKLGVNSAKSPTSIKLNSNSTSLALSNGSSRPSNVIGTTTLTPASKHPSSSGHSIQSSTSSTVTKSNSTSLSPNKTLERKPHGPTSPSQLHKTAMNRNGATGTNTLSAI